MRKRKKDSWLPDLLIGIPELIIYPIKWLLRGIFTIIKFWNCLDRFHPVGFQG
ncbi:hypothetical protein [Pseudalkalibacillus salsuginis]|uniref:hypothetical protein n=1 Tax=Pseudalkalibacillus salsuginis TaxID=2910972 RepID=UPI001F3FAF85|nr:hypothetical protein [Pseudalkalibacillus salsuginis]MCF6411352.1 hypothetical protein [Pseudalkalibacillus salsuginis]